MELMEEKQLKYEHDKGEKLKMKENYLCDLQKIYQ